MKVAITGVGIVDTLGNNPDLCFDNYMNKEHYPESCRSEHPAISHLKCFYADDELLVPETIQTSLYNSLHKINKLGLHSIEQALQTVPKSRNVAVVFSTITASGESNFQFHEYVNGRAKRLRPRGLIQAPRDFLAGLVPQVYDFDGLSVSMNAACSSSLYCVDYATKLVDEYDYVIVGGADVGTHLGELAYFNELGAIGTKSCPYDQDRDGFIMGEGAGCIILESVEKVEKRQGKVFGYIRGVGKGNDGSAGKATAPDPNSSGIKKAMREATKNFPIDYITFVNAHGTSTPVGDELEYHAIQEVLGDIDVVSFKSKIGHTMGASGVIELIYTLQAMKNGIIPPNHNIENLVEGLENVSTKPQGDVGAYALKNSLAFGGKNVSVLIEGRN